MKTYKERLDMITTFMEPDEGVEIMWCSDLNYETGLFDLTTIDWNWLMPVIEKICRTKIGDGDDNVEYTTLRTFGMLNQETGQIMVRFDRGPLFEADNLITATFNAVVDFIEYIEPYRVKE